MSCMSLCRSMVRNIQVTFQPKTEMQEKQLVQDPEYVKDVCCMLHSLSEITLGLFISY